MKKLLFVIALFVYGIGFEQNNTNRGLVTVKAEYNFVQKEILNVNFPLIPLILPCINDILTQCCICLI